MRIDRLVFHELMCFVACLGQAIVSAVTSGSKRYFLGTDRAPNERQRKECPFGWVGIYNAPVSLPLYTKVYEEVELCSILFFLTGAFCGCFIFYFLILQGLPPCMFFARYAIRNAKL